MEEPRSFPQHRDQVEEVAGRDEGRDGQGFVKLEAGELAQRGLQEEGAVDWLEPQVQEQRLVSPLSPAEPGVVEREMLRWGALVVGVQWAEWAGRVEDPLDEEERRSEKPQASCLWKEVTGLL